MVRIDMASSGFKQFSQPGVLQEIGRDLLVKFIDRLTPEMTAKNLSVPTPDLSDTAYFRSVADFFRSPELLPETLTQAASAIEGMGSPEAHDRLKKAAAQAGLALNRNPDATPAQIAVEVWLVAPALLANEQTDQSRPVLTKFHCFGARPPASGRAPFVMPGSQAIHALQADLDAWFSANGRGEQTTTVDVSTGEPRLFRPPLSQRDNATQPRVARNEPPWVSRPRIPSTLKGLRHIPPLASQTLYLLTRTAILSQAPDLIEARWLPAISHSDLRLPAHQATQEWQNQHWFPFV